MILVIPAEAEPKALLWRNLDIFKTQELNSLSISTEGMTFAQAFAVR
tara:strand:+ start:18846 stop:18986 length:141 start_codon:yes stop_codon:yes gene_type:complete